MPSVQLADVLIARRKLSKATYTIHTEVDGSRTMRTSGTTVVLPAEINYSHDILEIVAKHTELAKILLCAAVGVSMIAIESKLRENCSIDSETMGTFLALLSSETISTEAFAPAQVHDGKQACEGAPRNSDIRYLEGTLEECHGRLGDHTWEPPRLAVACAVEARPGYNSAKSDEYLDTPEVLLLKVKLLAEFFRRAKRPVIYAGAGLSTSSGISDYATQSGSQGLVAQKSSEAPPRSACFASPMLAEPSSGHHVLAGLARQGRVFRLIQQNHDGLPQKAGMPQRLLNEIHGSFFDPSNPVVAMSGSLRNDLFSDLLMCEEQADLVLALGSSLCGMNADRVVTSAAKRSNILPANSNPSILCEASSSAENPVYFGSVIVSIQRTVHDAESSLRIFGLIDEVMKLLAHELDIPAASLVTPAVPPEALVKFQVPYGPDGHRWAGPPLTLDLSEGAELIITTGAFKGAKCICLGTNIQGHYRLSVERCSKDGNRLFHETRLLGNWWPIQAALGELDLLPIAPAVLIREIKSALLIEEMAANLAQLTTRTSP